MWGRATSTVLNATPKTVISVICLFTALIVRVKDDVESEFVCVWMRRVFIIQRVQAGQKTHVRFSVGMHSGKYE